MFVCLLDELILGLCYSELALETGGFKLASTITLVLQANRLTKCASLSIYIIFISRDTNQPAFNCSKLTTETLEQGVE